jgi:hypothetical protein
MVMEMLGHTREMDVHFKYSGHSFLVAKVSSLSRFSLYSEDDASEDEESEEVSSSFSPVIL